MVFSLLKKYFKIFLVIDYYPQYLRKQDCLAVHDRIVTEPV